jgi:EmrB/QacA subfamily drug resistance transporter
MARPGAPQAASSLSKPPLEVSPWIILISLALGFFMILLDTTIVNVAIPSLIDGLHATLDQVLWILNAYIMAYAVLLIVTGRLGDMFGPKRLFLVGLLLFTVSSAICGLVQDPTQLIVFRIVQGIGGAILTPQSLSIITSIFPPEKRGGAFGVWAGVAGLAAITGPTLGGVLTTTFSWRAIFYVNVPIGIAAMVFAYLVMPELTIHRKHQLDIVGVLLATIGLFGVIFGLIEGERFSWGRINDVGAFSIGSMRASLISIPTIITAGLILLILFVLWETRQSEPLLPLTLFKDRNFSVANAVSLIVSFGMLGLFLPMTIYLQSVLNMTAMEAGVVFVPMSLTSMIVSPIMGRMSDRWPAKWILFTGLILFSVGMGLVIWTASLSSTGLSFTPALVVAGLGMGCTFAPMVTLAMRNISPLQSGAASGFINTVRQLGGTLGSAIVGAVLQYRLGNELPAQAAKYAQGLPAQFRAKFIQSFSHASSGGFHLGRGQTGAGQLPRNLPAGVARHLQQLGHAVFDHAFLNAMKPSLAVCIAGLLSGAAVTLLRRGGSARAAQAVPARREGVATAGE